MLISPEDSQGRHIILFPDATMKIPYKAHCQIPAADEWWNIGARNITNTRQIPLITRARTDENLYLITSEWLDIEEIVQAVKLGNTAAINRPRGRNFFQYLGPLALSEQTEQLWCIGSKGCYEVWVDHLGPDNTSRMNLVPMHAPDKDSSIGFDVSSLSRTLPVPLAMDSIVEIVAFSDEAAVIAVLTDTCESGCCGPSVRFFEY